MANKFLQPTSSGFRHPTDVNQMNGNIYNPKRMAMWGGMDKPKESRGYYTNNIQVKKPGQTIAK